MNANGVVRTVEAAAGAGSNHANRHDEVCVYCAAVGLPARRTSESTMASINTRARVGSWRLEGKRAHTGADSLRHSGRTWTSRPERTWFFTSTQEFMTRP